EGAVGFPVDVLDHRVQDHELEELEAGDPLLDEAAELVGAGDLARAAGQLEQDGRGRPEQLVELVERAATHDVGVRVLEATDREVVLRLRRELAHVLVSPGKCQERRSLRSPPVVIIDAPRDPVQGGRRMAKLGLYLDLRNPPAWRQDWHRLYDFTLELCEEAERLGADSVWLSEHHLFEDGYLTQPLTYAAAIAARTSRVRIGTAVVIAPFREPAQLAEGATIVDIVSNGRLDLGVGTGYRLPEFELFGKAMPGRYDRTDAIVRRLRELWRAGRLTPPPIQEPVPIWMGYQGPKGARRAGLLGEGLLALERSLLDPYRDGLQAGGHDPSSARMSGFVPVFVTGDPERDWPIVARHLRYQVESYRRYGVEGTGRPPP